MDDVEHSKPALPVVPDKCGPPTISLNYLLDFAIQQIYHEITVLSELLPKKLDGDRKISLVQFAHSTRMLFVKLLAVVKWVKSSKKFESCAAICYLLDQQSQYFIETADRLVTISREELVVARLPAFQVTAAVDVLTQGTYLHLPTIIQERFTLKPKISAVDEANVLLRLNQVLQYRISKVASTLSPRIKGIVIKNGMLILTVPGEFEVHLTVLGEREQTPWTLLNIKMLVEDYEIGYGAQLVHPLQLNMLHNVLQSRMDVAKNAISEVYNFLHAFAQSLQLDVLFCQASQLAAGRLRNKIIIEKYNPKERMLSIGYWVQRITKKGMGNHVRLVPQYRVTIYGDESDDSSLKVRHYPIAPDLGQLDDRTGRLSIDRLLSETLVVRCRERLLRIRKRLKAAKPLSIVLYAGAATPCLWLPLLRDSVDTREECVVISTGVWVHEQTGISVGGPVDTIATSIIERLTRYSHIYDTVNRFAKAYDAHYNKLCSVQAYTFHKLVIAYGRERDQQLIVSFRPRNATNDRFNLNFGQTLPISIYDSLEVNLQETTRWNAHCMVATILKEKFNAKSDLTELVHYLVTTSEPLHSLSFFSRIRFQSCKVLAQLFNVEIPYPLILKFHLMPINEVTLRLTYGHIHLEFIMLSGDSVAVRDSSRDKPRCAGLHQFFHLLSNGTSRSCKEESKFTRTTSPMQPASLPPNIVDASPAAHMSASLSVPPTSDASVVSPATFGAAAELETSSAPVVIDHETLRRAFNFIKFPGSNLLHAPLDDYLNSLCFIRKLTLAFEAHMRHQSAGRVPFNDMRSGLDYVRVTVPVATPPAAQRTDTNAPQTPQPIGGLVSFNFHLDPHTLCLKLNIEYSKNSPSPSDLMILERYFEQVVSRLNNELAVFSFINLCRMDPSPSTYWNVSIRLVCFTRDQMNTSVKRYQIAIVYDANLFPSKSCDLTQE
ncbi:mediator complex subunit MED14 [Oesophagostomum dentatum]|uniref:Mediator of RNA polymerase II transcription subunit 14 n=1 Tax=Oesophagostomum dentatum TaxID=61180 RepID=A0A0B1T965_OESDE|nr:mediator complex subunit MED14 [Oesophagostomum dentatum]